jgi:hypothetical protein
MVGRDRSMGRTWVGWKGRRLLMTDYSSVREACDVYLKRPPKKPPTPPEVGASKSVATATPSS